MNLGEKIKDKRIQLGLTQQELANRCELTKGYISQLENDKTDPSIETLKHILEVLGLTLGEFFSSQQETKLVFKEEDQYDKSYKGYMQTWLVPTSQILEMEPVLVEIEPLNKTVVDMPHPGEEFGYVIEGEVTVVFGKMKKNCKKGEAFYYSCKNIHYLENNKNETAKVVWVSCPPNF